MLQRKNDSCIKAISWIELRTLGNGEHFLSFIQRQADKDCDTQKKIARRFSASIKYLIRIISFGCRLWLVRSEHRYSSIEMQSKLSCFLKSSIFNSLICFSNSSVAFIWFPYSITSTQSNSILAIFGIFYILPYWKYAMVGKTAHSLGICFLWTGEIIALVKYTLHIV